MGIALQRTPYPSTFSPAGQAHNDAAPFRDASVPRKLTGPSEQQRGGGVMREVSIRGERPVNALPGRRGATKEAGPFKRAQSSSSHIPSIPQRCVKVGAAGPFSRGPP
ncbi:hypothetical protein WMY93_005539 [Mugilogobius chulae]|uniref:Uncharacterized protein n=1 Tax=Mugilogobius chulae TaxID=88201 RepID=A0AAW0PK88_9GOBI